MKVSGVVLLLSVIAIANAQLRVRTWTGLSNAYIISSATETMVIDTGYSPIDGAAILGNATAVGLPIRGVYITHAHPDHFGGLSAFVQATIPVYVASAQALGLLTATATFVNGGQNPYQNITINILAGTTITWLNGYTFQVNSSLPPSEADVSSVVYEPTNKYLFAGDLIYGRDHLYLGQTVDRPKIFNWISTLQGLATNYAGATVFPGHGINSTDIVATTTQNIMYLNFFLTQICNPAYNSTTVSGALVAQYPTLGGQFVLSFIPQNAAWATKTSAGCPAVSSSAPVATTANTNNLGSTPITPKAPNGVSFQAPLLFLIVALIVIVFA
jgi:glyoxylase-like metal-dependent hydrolase (beta-lactamase superfamily II)